MASKWKEKKKVKRQEELAKRQAESIIRSQEAERERIRRYNREYRKAHLAETAARQRRWRANMARRPSTETTLDTKQPVR